jgi:hypothetical protein
MHGPCLYEAKILDEEKITSVSQKRSHLTTCPKEVCAAASLIQAEKPRKRNNKTHNWTLQEGPS